MLTEWISRSSVQPENVLWAGLLQDYQFLLVRHFPSLPLSPVCLEVPVLPLRVTEQQWDRKGAQLHPSSQAAFVPFPHCLPACDSWLQVEPVSRLRGPSPQTTPVGASVQILCQGNTYWVCLDKDGIKWEDNSLAWTWHKNLQVLMCTENFKPLQMCGVEQEVTGRKHWQRDFC